MFKKLKDKLDSFKEAISSTIDRKAAGVEEAQKTDKKKVGVVKRAKTLIVERELILDESDLEGPLWDLEMALLESDVALPVAES
ncbi:MAG: signal recognition particle receptor subunit alpha, partial [Euryarchaeota archaeon]|nr:signal recognition particle receptor subunit alpha [Euryarchaeota archaeon]